MNRRQKIILSVTGIFLVLLILVGLTYAYFLTQIRGNTNNKNISVTTANLALEYGDGNGLITGTNIIPGTTLTTKTFIVENNGNISVEYGVYLEELINEFERTSDLELTVTCESSVTSPSQKTCDGYDGVMLTENGQLVTNTIDVGETQLYRLTLNYVETNTDQSVDMKKRVEAKVQIYGLADTVDLNGTITDANNGDYVIVNSTPKRSEIINGQFKVVGLMPGEHEINVYNSSDTLRYTKEITINKGSTESISGTTATITDETRTLKVNISSSSISLSLAPFDEGTLAYAIYSNAKTSANGTTFRTTPLTTPAEEATTYGTGEYENIKISEIVEFTEISLYIDDTEETENPTLTQYNSCTNSDIGKYLFREGWGYELIGQIGSCQNGEYIINNEKITYLEPSLYIDDTEEADNPTLTQYNSCTNSDIGKYIFEEGFGYMLIGQIGSCIDGEYALYTEIEEDEKSLSIAKDDLGTSYYYRGNVSDNYVNFANMCWRIVRILGDGSVKLILEDRDQTCESSNGNWDIPTTTGGSTFEGNFGYDNSTYTYTYETFGGEEETGQVVYANYLNPMTNSNSAQVTAYKNFQTGPLSNYLNKLRPGNWCYDDKAYTNSTGGTVITNKIAYYTTRASFYYDTFVRLFGKETIEPTLRCNGTIMNKFGDNTTDMYVATLTADEIVYAGGKVSDAFFGDDGVVMFSYYLLNDYQKNRTDLSWWSLSLVSFGDNFGSDDSVYVVTSDGIMFNYFEASDFAFRPAIQLKSGTTISGGVGTKANPYVIN